MSKKESSPTASKMDALPSEMLKRIVGGTQHDDKQNIDTNTAVAMTAGAEDVGSAAGHVAPPSGPSPGLAVVSGDTKDSSAPNAEPDPELAPAMSQDKQLVKDLERLADSPVPEGSGIEPPSTHVTEPSRTMDDDLRQHSTEVDDLVTKLRDGFEDNNGTAPVETKLAHQDGIEKEAADRGSLREQSLQDALVQILSTIKDRDSGAAAHGPGEKPLDILLQVLDKGYEEQPTKEVPGQDAVRDQRVTASSLLGLIATYASVSGDPDFTAMIEEIAARSSRPDDGEEDSAEQREVKEQRLLEGIVSAIRSAALVGHNVENLKERHKQYDAEVRAGALVASESKDGDQVKAAAASIMEQARQVLEHFEHVKRDFKHDFSRDTAKQKIQVVKEKQGGSPW